MDLPQLRYAVEIAQAGSISKAAKNLYMGQPNLSKSIRELEEELGRPLFRRTAQGVEPTRAGEEFVLYARKILEQIDGLQALYKPRRDTDVHLSLCVPRASYIASAFCHWAERNVGGQFQLQYRETNAMDTIDRVTNEEAQLGIVRYHTERADYFEHLAAANGIHLAPLWDFSMMALMHKNHPLAALDSIPYHRLSDYPEVMHGDLSPDSPEDLTPTARDRNPAARILVFDRAAQFDVLRSVRGSFMWVSPLPFYILEREEMVQRPCPSVWVYRDAAVWKGSLLAGASSFLDAVHDEINGLI